ncbi:MAG TPA: MFS transporter [Candidatus Sulfotelmatobacter sp.]|nr:MFS transporter [Candidatus Sulfotelmatobacter sp.]
MTANDSTTGGMFGSSSARKAVIGSFFGTALEAYDFLLYGSAAGLVFSRLFFPGSDPLAGTLLAFATYAVGFVARPIGGVLIGNYGDRIGRKPMLMLTLGLMGAVTAVIGLLPTYAQIGILAPILLTVLRFVQGIAYGGEWGGAVLVVIEHAPRNRRGFLGGFPNGGVPLGLVVAAGLLSLSATWSGPDFLTWGWRVPFLASVFMILIGLYVRTKIVETPEFLEVQRQGRAPRVPVLEAIRRHPREILLTAGAFLLINGGYFVIVVFMLTYGGIKLGVGIPTMLNAVMIASFFQIFASIGFGALSDRVGRLPVVMGAAIFIGLYIFPLFWMVETRDPVIITVAMTVALIAFGAVYGPVAAFFTEIYDTDVRYSGASLGYQLGAVFGGGLAPLIATSLQASAGGATWPVSLYVIALAVIAVVCLSLLGETNRERGLAPAE